jgi:hypothetical protein
VVTGVATFDSVPPNPNGSLNYAAMVSKPVRAATVQLLGASGNVLATTSTNTTGFYRFEVPTAQAMTVRVRAELKTPQADFTVRDNTAGNALFAMDSASFTPNAASTVMNTHAASGWGGANFTSTRVAAPFAILDVAYLAHEKIMTTAPTSVLPPLVMHWSPNNRPAGGDRAQGFIGTSSFTFDASGRPVMYLLGAENVDTDEYDRPVVAHEMGHYIQQVLSRDDSVGGPHNGDDKLDMRLAFSEGWGNAWSGIVLESAIYHDSEGTGQRGGFAIDVSAAPNAIQRGWFNETTVQHLLWRANQDIDVGFTRIHAALVSMRSSGAFTSLHHFYRLLKDLAPGNTTLTPRAAAAGVANTDIYGAGETFTGGLASVLPIYQVHRAPPGASQGYCVVSTFGGTNKLGTHAFVSLTLPSSGTRTITVTRANNIPANTDPDITLVQPNGTRQQATTGNANVEILTVNMLAGTHVLALNDFNLKDSGSGSCFDMRID